MAVISDTNILSSLAAANALDLLGNVFVGDDIFIPPAVLEELQVGLAYGRSHLKRVFEAIDSGEIQVLPLNEAERTITKTLPSKLHAGEREGIALCQARKHIFLSNDKRAGRYCQVNGIQVVNLEAFLRLLWVRDIYSQQDVTTLIKSMEIVEKLILKQAQRDKIFAPRHGR